MEVWGTNNEDDTTIPLRSTKDVINARIPIKSSILSAVIIIVNVTLAISFTLLIRYLGFDDIAIPVCRAIVIVHLSVQMPLILWLTIKNQRKNKNNKPKPPHGLQFHGKQLSTEDDNKTVEKEKKIDDTIKETYIKTIEVH